MMLLWLALACPPKTGASPAPVAPLQGAAAPEAPTQEPRVGEVGVPVGPGAWEDSVAGLILQVPAGWSGRSGSVGAPTRLELVHTATGARFKVVVATEPSLPELAGCVWRFHDGSGHRSAPGLGVASAASCVPNDPAGVTIWAWTSEGAAQVVRIELWSPADQVVASRVAADPLIGSVLRR